MEKKCTSSIGDSKLYHSFDKRFDLCQFFVRSTEEDIFHRFCCSLHIWKVGDSSMGVGSERSGTEWSRVSSGHWACDGNDRRVSASYNNYPTTVHLHSFSPEYLVLHIYQQKDYAFRSLRSAPNQPRTT